MSEVQTFSKDTILTDVTTALCKSESRAMELEAALVGMLKKYGPHSGACVVWDTATTNDITKKLVITEASCVCSPEVKAAYKALGRWRIWDSK